MVSAAAIDINAETFAFGIGELLRRFHGDEGCVVLPFLDVACADVSIRFVAAIDPVALKSLRLIVNYPKPAIVEMFTFTYAAYLAWYWRM